MARVIVTIEDNIEGGVDAGVEFDPPLKVDLELTPAQSMGASFLDYLGAKPK